MKTNKKQILSILLLLLLCVSCSSDKSTNQRDMLEAETDVEIIEKFQLLKKNSNQILIIPGEIKAYESVDIFPKIKGFIEKIYVDKGSLVKKGQLLMTLNVPELLAEINAAKSELESLQAQYQRLVTANETPGVISANELDISEKNYLKAAATLKALQETNTYTEIRAPFDGVITERNYHTGALVGSDNQNYQKPLLHIDQISTLRIIVPVPEYATRGIKHVDKLKFTVTAYPDKEFSAQVTRKPISIDPITRTQNIELDFDNSQLVLAPGMYPEIEWRLIQEENSFLVPKSALIYKEDKVFLIKFFDDKFETILVKKGYDYDKEVEVFGELQEGDFFISNVENFDLDLLETN